MDAQFKLSFDAISRILKKTRIEESGLIERAEAILSESDFVYQFNLWSNAMTAYKSNRKILANLERAAATAQKLRDFFEIEDENVDDVTDFLSALKRSEEKIGIIDLPCMDERISFLKRLEISIKNAHALIQVEQYAFDKSREPDAELNKLVADLWNLYGKIYKTKPAIDSMVKDNSVRESPFLRFAAGTMAEMKNMGLPIKSKNMSHDAIRTRIKLLQKSGVMPTDVK